MNTNKKTETITDQINKVLRTIGNIFSYIIKVITNLFNWISENLEIVCAFIIFILLAIFFFWLSWKLNEFALSYTGWVIFIIICIAILWFFIFYVYGKDSHITWCANAICPFFMLVFYNSFATAGDIKVKQKLYD